MDAVLVRLQQEQLSGVCPYHFHVLSSLGFKNRRSGTLELADGVAQSLAKLPLLASGVSGLALGEGSALSLAEGGLSFAEGARLAVTGPEVKEMHRTGLRVGTTACLPVQALSKIKYNDLTVCQDKESYILVVGRGTFILFR